MENKMNWNIPLKLAEQVVSWFWNTCEVKKFVVSLLEKYVAGTDNEIDDKLVAVVKERLLSNC